MRNETIDSILRAERISASTIENANLNASKTISSFKNTLKKLQEEEFKKNNELKASIAQKYREESEKYYAEQQKYYAFKAEKIKENAQKNFEKALPLVLKEVQNDS